LSASAAAPVPRGCACGGAREVLPDVLRALALIGVLVVNAAGYLVAPWGPVLAGAQPEGSAVATAALALQAGLLQGKAYPVLAFLFGMGLALALRGARRRGASVPSALAQARRRLGLLLLLGVLHGLLLYFGDILTAYALCGLTLMGALHEPWQRLRKRIRRAWGWALFANLVLLALVALAVAAGMDLNEGAEERFALSRTVSEFLALNASAYLLMQVGSLLFALPLLRLCMLLGLAAARLRWFSAARFATARLAWMRRLIWPAVLANGFYAGLVVLERSSGAWGRLGWSDGLAPWIGPLGGAAWVLWLVQRWQSGGLRPLQALQPLGQRTLSLYVGHSLLCVVLFSGIGLQLHLGTVGLLFWALGLWTSALWLARAQPGLRWPLEAWLARR
jgi:uncharacterized protein